MTELVLPEKINRLKSDYIQDSAEIKLLDGLRKAIEQALSHAQTGIYTVKGDKHDRKKKFE